jgi:hypothetical protein
MNRASAQSSWRVNAWAEMEERLRVFEAADEWTGPNQLLLTAARR